MKKLVPLSGIAWLCVTHAACAQSSVTIYGIIDSGIEYQNGGTGAVVRGSSGGLQASLYGFTGTEDLGGGMHANFKLEQGFNSFSGAQATAGSAFSRLAWVGLSGHFGEVRVGRQKKAEYLLLNNETDPVGAQSIASPINNFSQETQRSNNAIAYLAPTFHGLSGQLMVGMRDSTTRPSNGFQYYNAAVRYINGPFHAGAGYEQQGNATGTSLQRIFRALGSYRFGPARIYFAYQAERQSDGSEDVRIYSVSGSYLFTPAAQLALLYGYANDVTGKGNNAQQFSLTYTYSLSKATMLYAAGTYIDNRNKATFTPNGTGYRGVTVAAGFNSSAAIVGIIHRF